MASAPDVISKTSVAVITEASRIMNRKDKPTQRGSRTRFWRGTCSAGPDGRPFAHDAKPIILPQGHRPRLTQMPPIKRKLQPGTRVEVTQHITSGEQAYTCTVVGTVQSHQTEPTGAWFAHDKGGRLLLDRLKLRKDDGEDTVLVLGGHTIIKVLPPD